MSVLDPSRGTARDWALQELADPAYATARPGWAQRLAGWLLRHLQLVQLPGAPGRGLGLVLLVAVLALLVALVLWRVGGLRAGVARRARAAVLDDVRRTAAEHRRLADAAAAAGRFDEAVRERFRAVTRALEERVVLDERPGRTAAEVAAEAGLALPGSAAALRAGARVFDDVTYGGRPGTPDADRGLRALDEQVAAERPRQAALVGSAASGPDGPPGDRGDRGAGAA